MQMNKFRLFTKAMPLLLLCSSAFAQDNSPSDPCLAFTCMAGKLQGNEATSGTDCISGRQSFFSIKIFTPFYNPEATAAARRTYLSTCPSTSVSENKATLEMIVQRYGRSPQE